MTKLVKLIMTIPCTSVSVERSFSAMKRIKTVVRSTMAQDRLASLGRLHIENQLLASVKTDPNFYDTVIDDFATEKDRRIDLKYK